MRSHTILSILTFTVLAFSFTSCSEDDPVAPQDDHFEAIGVVLSNSGIKVLSILRGVTTDTLHATVGVLSDHFDIQFYDEDEKIVDPPHDEHHTLGWEITDTSILEVVQDAGHEGEFEFHLRGKKAGSTQIEFFILHEGHADFKSGKIPVIVR